MYTPKTMTQEEKDRFMEEFNRIRGVASPNHVRWTLFKILLMISKGQLRFAKEQRNFCTKYSNGIINSFIFLGFLPELIFIKTKDTTPEGLPIYDVFDGRQRLTSLLLFISGYHLDGKIVRTYFEFMFGSTALEGIDLKALNREFAKFIGKDVVLKARPMAINLKEDNIADLFSENFINIADGKSFIEIPEQAQDSTLQETFLSIDIEEWDDTIRAKMFANINQGQEKATPMENIKPLMPASSWERVHNYANGEMPIEFRANKENRFGKEYLILQLFSCYLRHKNGEDFLKSWDEENTKNGTLPSDLFAKEFEEFKKEFKAFSDNGLLEASALYVRKVKDENKYILVGEKGKLAPKTVNLLALFNLWLNKNFADTTAEKAYSSYMNFTTEFVSDVAKGNVFRNNLTNGTGNTSRVKNQAAIMVDAYLPFLKAEE